MKKHLCLVLCLTLLIGLLAVLPASAAATVTATASGSSVLVNSTVTLTLKFDGGDKGIGSLDAQLQYNAKSFEYVSCTNATANGSAGVVKLSYFSSEAVPSKTVAVTLTFKAIAAGSGDFSLTTEGMWDDTDALLGTPSAKVEVAATNPTLSGNANLASLKPSKGTLTPKFSANTTEYTVSVDYSVTSLTLSATTADKGAKTAISGKNALAVGKNTRVITVTAPNGSTKKYTVVITREPQKATTTGQSGGTTTTTAPPPAADALEVTVGGVLMTVADTQPQVDLPAGYIWDYIELNRVDVPAARNMTTDTVMLYLTNEVTATGNFYIYYATAGEFELFRPLKVAGGNYTLLEMPAGQNAPAGTVPSTFPYEGGTVNAFAYEDTGLADYLIVYAISPAGVTGLYVYDRTDGSFQRYYQQPALQAPPVDAPPNDGDQEPKENAFVAFVTRHRSVLLTVGAAGCGLALFICATVFAVRLIPGSRKKGKH